jgi:simple sugar transport system substrate-binding protein
MQLTDDVRVAFVAMSGGKLNAAVECIPLMGPQLMTWVTEAVSGRPIPRRHVVDEAGCTMDSARHYIQTRKY